MNKLYRIYDPKTCTYLKTLYCRNYVAFTTSKNPNTLLSELKLTSNLKEAAKLERYKKGLTKKDSTDSQSLARNMKEVNDAIAFMKRIQIQEVEIIDSKSSINLERIKRKAYSRCLDDLLNSKYNFSTATWFKKFEKSKKKNRIPYCILESTWSPWLAEKDHKFLEEQLSIARSNGIDFQAINLYSKDILIYSENDYNLFKLTINFENFYRTRVLFKDLIKLKKRVEKDIEKQFKLLSKSNEK